MISPTEHTRRKFLSLGLASMAIAALPNDRAQAAELEKVRVSIIPINDVAPLFVAIKKGYFREVGLEIDTTPSAGGATGIPGLVGGSFDIAYGNVVSALLARSRGLGVKIIAPGTKKVNPALDTTAVITRTDSGIKTGRDLEGKTFAVNTRNNVIWLYGRAWIKAVGGDPDKVDFKEIPFPQMEDALLQRRVDAAFVVAPFSIVASSKPELVAIAHPYTDLFLGADVGEWLTSDEVLAAKPETIAKFVAGLRKGAEWYNANRQSDELLQIITGYAKTDASLLRSIPLSAAPLRSDPPQIGKTMGLMIENKLLDKPVDLAQVIDPLALQGSDE